MNTDTALITGASSGIGLHLAREFARHGHPLVLVAPVAAEINAIATELEAEHGVGVRAIAKDLEQESSATEIFAELQQAGVPIDILVNNAGQGFHGDWVAIPIEKDVAMVRLNIEAPLRLTKLFLPPMLQRGHGRVLNTASVAGFGPGPQLTTYYATKAFVLSWSEALATELEDTAITVTALCPGVTDTDFFPKSDGDNMKGRQSSNVLAPQEVAEVGYKALMEGELFVIPGIMNKAMIAARRILPAKIFAKLNGMMNSDVPPEKQTHHRGEKEFAEEEEHEAASPR